MALKSASFQTLLSTDILQLILQHLTRRNALQLSAVCQELREVLAAGKFTYKPRFIVVASETNAILDICPKSGQVLGSAKVLSRALRKKEKLSSFWPTGIALSPCDGDYYVCQYKGQSVLQFKGLDLTFRCVAVKFPQGYTNPEGICFSKCCLYVACATPGAIWRFAKGADSGRYEAISVSPISYYEAWGGAQQAHVPWGMTTGPDGNLYVAMEEEYQDLRHLPLGHRQGSVMVAKLDEQGEFLGLEKFCGSLDGKDERLCRPSGISFDDHGNLYVTSLTSQVLMYNGPLSDNPGEFVKVVACWRMMDLPRGAGTLLPWDVKWHPGIPGIGNGPIVFVTRHTDMRRKSRSRVSVVSAETGTQVHTIFSEHLRLGNMMAME